MHVRGAAAGELLPVGPEGYLNYPAPCALGTAVRRLPLRLAELPAAGIAAAGSGHWRRELEVHAVGVAERQDRQAEARELDDLAVFDATRLQFRGGVV